MNQQLKLFYKVCRWLHIYVSASLFGLLVFFCFSGVVLNHPAWLQQKASQQNETHDFPIEWLSQSQPIIQSKLIALVRLQTGVNLPRSIEWFPEDGELVLDYDLPAGYLLVTADLRQKQFVVERSQGNWLSVWADLHKGRHSGLVWSWLIDVSAILMLVFAITGLAILLQNRSNKRKGMLAMFCGCLSPFVLYLLFVPTF